MLATEYAEYYEIEAQREGESDMDFRLRIASTLREKGHIIEASEAYHDQRYEESDTVVSALFGEVGRAMGKVPQYSKPGTHSDEGDKVAAGTILRHKEDNPDPMMLLIAAMM